MEKETAMMSERKNRRVVFFFSWRHVGNPDIGRNNARAALGPLPWPPTEEEFDRILEQDIPQLIQDRHHISRKTDIAVAVTTSPLVLADEES